jgi:hypothetical protein
MWPEINVSRIVASLSLCLMLLVTTLPADAQSPGAVNDFIARVNRERVTRGLAPYAMSAQLTAAAQGHANDLATRGSFSHVGSDGSTTAIRVQRKGYRAYKWGFRVGENWAWYHDAASAMGMWMDSAPHRANLLNSTYREMGIGIARAADGRFVYVVDFGSQPNVLPVFISDGSLETSSPRVTLTLSNEDLDKDGDGPGVIGQAVQVLISNDARFSGARWQPYAPRIPWTLPSAPGNKTVYVQFRDARGRTVTSSASIYLNSSLPLARLALAQPPTLTETPQLPTKTVTRAPTRIAVKVFTKTPTQVATRVPSKAPTAKPRPSWTPTQGIVQLASTDTPEPSSMPTTETLLVAQAMRSTATRSTIQAGLPPQAVSPVTFTGLSLDRAFSLSSLTQLMLGVILGLVGALFFKVIGSYSKGS